MTTWLELPPELRGAILCNLPLRDRVRARLVCRDWKSLLDTCRCLWPDFRRLTVNGGQRWHREEPSDNHGLTLQYFYCFSRACDPGSLLSRFSSALGFLWPRSPLTSLELDGYGAPQAISTAVQMLVAAGAASMQLQSLVLNVNPSFLPKIGRAELSASGELLRDLLTLRAALAVLIEKQPGLRTLVLAGLDDCNVLKEIECLEHLRIFVYSVSREESARVTELPVSLLNRLDCLAVSYYHHQTGSYDAVRESVEKAAASQYRHVWEKAPGLLLLQHDLSRGWMSSCCWRSRILWARNGFPVATAMADKRIYSRNFLVESERLVIDHKLVGW